MIPFDLDRIERETFVRRIEHREETPSTNTLALELVERAATPLPLLVIATRQTAGRGRGANRWWSSEGALTFSVVLPGDEALTSARRPLVSLAAGVAVCDAVSQLLPRSVVGVKWPNDVYLDGKKVSGILVESADRAGRMIVGVGVNVNNTLQEAPEDIANKAVALVDIDGGMFSLTHVLIEVLRQLAKQWELLSGSEHTLIEAMRRRCLLTGRRVTLDAAGERIAGLCCGVASDGALLVETPTGRRSCYAGVVTAWE